MTGALIGHTGFVGGNLALQEPFEHTYNSSNINKIEGRSFRRVVCAGVQAVKWWANKNPSEDLTSIDRLIRHLSTIETDMFTLISTVDVYEAPRAVDEEDSPPRDKLHAYGLNRLRLEDFVQARFSCNHIVRLPALFGRGLKKNVIFDLMNNNMLETINPKSSFQWYPLRRLSADLQSIEAKGIPLVNFVTEPIEVGEIQRMFFSQKEIGSKAGSAVHYDIHTRHASAFGQKGKYILSQEDVMKELTSYLKDSLA